MAIRRDAPELFGTGARGFGNTWGGSNSMQVDPFAGETNHTGRGPKGYQRSDERIREDVCVRLTDHPGIDASEIEVLVDAGEVTLSGTVDARTTKRLAEEVAESVSGVRDVHNQLRIGPHARP
jgi:osmotically-inducible protein OsmY